MRLHGAFFLICAGTILTISGCMSPSYSDLKQELEATRYQYDLERLYVAGLKVQNRQLTERVHELRFRLERLASQTVR